MIIAHGPLGYLTARLTHTRWGTLIDTIYHKRLYVIALVGGMIPDIDLLYFYFVDSSLSHRQYITHSFFPYVMVLLLGIVLWNIKHLFPTMRYQRWHAMGTILFGMAGISHIIVDSLVGLTVMLAPFNWTLLGFPALGWYDGSWLNSYQLPFILTLEVVIILVAIGSAFKLGKKFWLGAILTVLAAAGSLLYLRAHVYSANGLFYYDDIDADGVLNAQDRDIDGDGIDNIDDTDIDDDGELNTLELYQETFSIEGTLYDYTEGANVEVPLRLGLLTPEYTILRTYANVGIFMGLEMAEDYARNSTGYIGMPGDNTFSEQVENWETWWQNTNRLQSANTYPQEYDVLVFNSGHVALYVNTTGEQSVLESHPSHAYSTVVPLDEVIQREGEVRSIGRMLPPE